MGNLWITGYGGTPIGGATPVWIAPNDGTVPSATLSTILGYGGTPTGGATAAWIAGYGAAVAGASPICISSYGLGGGGGGGTSSTWSAADATANGMTLSNGGLTLSIPTGTAAWRSARTSIAKTSGKLYLEVITGTGSDTTFHAGLASAGIDIANYLGASPYSFGYSVVYGNVFASAGFSGLTAGNNFGLIVPNDVIGIAVDFTANKVWIGVNNVWSSSGNPATGANPLQSFVPATVGPLFFGMSFNTVSGAQTKANNTWTLQSTAAALKYAPPSGFTAWDAP